MRNIIFAALLGVLAGCSDNVALKGKVVFSDDKSPVPVGTVSFETETFSARGELNPDGTFTVGSLKTNDGLPAGTYRVAITNAVKVLSVSDDENFAVTEPLIDEKHADARTSGITVDVTPSTKFIEIEVDRYQPDKKR